MNRTDTFIEVTPDGKQEIGEGKEPLKKPHSLDAAQSNYQDAQNEKKRKLEKEDKIKGGAADKSKPSDFNNKQLEMGIKVEMEHTSDKSIAKEIAMDHLKEFPDYYTRLNTMEDKAKKETVKKSLRSRWELMKKDFDHESAFMDIEIEDKDKKEDEEEGGENEDTATESDEGGEPDIDQMLSEMGAGDEGENPEEESDTATESDDEEIPEDVVAEAGGEEEVDKMSEEDISSMMKEMGYSASEIAHVVHGVNVHRDLDEDRSQEMHEQELELKRQEIEAQQSNASLEDGHNKSTKEEDLKRVGKLNDIEIEHEKKMKELDYTMARRAREMELEYKEKELALKLKHTDKDAKAKREQKKDAQSKKASDPKDKRQLVDNIVN